MPMRMDQPFDVPRENLRLAWRWMQLASNWRKHFHATQMQAIDLGARPLKRGGDAIAACSDWNEVAASMQRILRDHAVEMMSLVQESIGLELSNRNALTQVFSQSLMDWKRACLGHLDRMLVGGNASVITSQAPEAQSRQRTKGEGHVA